MKAWLFATSSLVGLGFVLLNGSLIPLVDQVRAAETQRVTIRFHAKVGNQLFQCGDHYALGTSATMVAPTDFRFYVSEVSLIDVNGNAVPMTLEQDGKWQYQSVALLDFENKVGACANGTQDTHDHLSGTVPVGDYRGIRFTMGVPVDLNHADATLAASPLNLTSLWWNWQGGYKFLRIDLAPVHRSSDDATREWVAHEVSPVHPLHDSVQGFAIHLGSTGCQPNTSLPEGMSCANPNRAEVTLELDPMQDVIVADLAALVASTDIATNQPNTPAGCMASPEDLDCLGIMHNVGLPFNGQEPSGQTFFRVE